MSEWTPEREAELRELIGYDYIVRPVLPDGSESFLYPSPSSGRREMRLPAMVLRSDVVDALDALAAERARADAAERERDSALESARLLVQACNDLRADADSLALEREAHAALRAGVEALAEVLGRYPCPDTDRGLVIAGLRALLERAP